MSNIHTITRQELKRRLAKEFPNNQDDRNGYALVNVLGAEAFEREHIPNSINIPLADIDRFEQRFSKDKDIIVYCASLSCDASPKAATALEEKGFQSIFDYSGGLSDWKEAGNGVAGSAARAN